MRSGAYLNVYGRSGSERSLVRLEQDTDGYLLYVPVPPVNTSNSRPTRNTSSLLHTTALSDYGITKRLDA